jgi:hypothetical protein
MAPSCDPTAIQPHGETGWRGCRHQRDVVPFGMLEHLPGLQAGAHAGSSATVVATRLAVAGEKLKPLQIVCPDAERAGPSAPANKIMARVSARCQYSALFRGFFRASQTNLITNRTFLSLAKSTAA